MALANVLVRSRHETLFWVMVLIIGAISGEGANPTSKTLRGVNLHYEV